jgi:hypothetical protein
MIKNRQCLIFNWDITTEGNRLKTSIKLPFNPTHFKLKHLSVLSPSVINNQGIIILNTNLVDNHIPYLGIIIDDEATVLNSEFKIDKNKVNHSDCIFYVETLADNPNLYGFGAAPAQQQIGIGGGGNVILDMDILFTIEFLEYE